MCGFAVRGWLSPSVSSDTEERALYKSAQDPIHFIKDRDSVSEPDLPLDPLDQAESVAIVDKATSPASEALLLINAALNQGQDAAAAYALLLENREVLGFEEFESTLEHVLSKWAQQNPAMATRYIGQLESPELVESVYRSIAAGWANQNVKEAFTWLQSPATSEFSDSLLVQCYRSIMYRYAELDPVAAAEIVGDLQSETIQSELMYPIIENYVNHDYDQALQWALSLEQEGMRGFALNHLIDVGEAQDSEKVFSAVLQNQANLPSHTLASVFQKLSAGDPLANAEKLYQLSENKQSAVAQSFTAEWLKRDQAAAINWLASQSQRGPVLDGAAEAVVDALSYNAPGTAYAWAEKVSDPVQRVSLVSQVIMNAQTDQLDYLDRTIGSGKYSGSELATLQSLLDERIREASAPLIVPE